MSILLIGDPHFKTNNSKETTKFTEETLKYVEREKDNISFIVILGDVLDTHEKVHLQPLCRAVQFIKDLSKIKFTFILIGNHDRINNKVFLTKEHGLVGLKSCKNIKIIDEVFKHNNLLFVPYVEPGRFQEALDTLEFDMSEIKAIFAHQEFYGCNMKSYNSEIGDKWDLSNPPVFSGHIHQYHKPQENITYVGTPYQINFGENEDKSLLLLNSNGDTERIYLPVIKKKTIKLKADELEKIELDDDIEWRLIIEGEVNYIKNLLTKPKLKEKIKRCHLVFNYDIPTVDKKQLVSSFDTILKEKISKLSIEEQEYFNYISSSDN